MLANILKSSCTVMIIRETRKHLRRGKLDLYLCTWLHEFAPEYQDLFNKSAAKFRHHGSFPLHIKLTKVT